MLLSLMDCAALGNERDLVRLMHCATLGNECDIVKLIDCAAVGSVGILNVSKSCNCFEVSLPIFLPLIFSQIVLLPQEMES